MGELSPDEKQKIHEEEKVRNEAQPKLNKEDQKKARWQSQFGWGEFSQTQKGFLIAILIIVGLILLVISPVGFSITGIAVALWSIWRTNKLSRRTKIILTSAISVVILLVGVSSLIPKEEIKKVKRAESVNYNVVKKKAPQILEGETEVQREGVPGEKIVTYREKYVNDKLVSKKKIGEQITKDPVSEIVLVGSLPKEVKIREAKNYYQRALDCCDEEDYQGALKQPDKAINIYPGYYEEAELKKEEVQDKLKLKLNSCS